MAIEGGIGVIIRFRSISLQIIMGVIMAYL